jgi:hypothetical protein
LHPALFEMRLPAGSAGDPGPFDIPRLKGLARRASAVGLLVRNKPRAGIPAAEIVSIVRDVCRKATADPRLDSVVPALWRIEATTVGAGREPREPMPLLTHPVPEPAQAIAHVGWGTGVAQRLGFDAGRLRAELAATTAERYRDFCWDGVGADLLIHARPPVRMAARALGMIGSATPPNSDGGFRDFRAALSPEEDRLVAHGVGRMILVTHASVGAALEKVERLPSEWRPAGIQGIAFAFLMLNYADAATVLDRSRLLPASFARFFRDGLVYALVFSDWLGRGLLNSWRPHGSFESELLARARLEAELNLQRGHPLPFALSEPA